MLLFVELPLSTFVQARGQDAGDPSAGGPNEIHSVVFEVRHSGLRTYPGLVSFLNQRLAQKAESPVHLVRMSDDF